MRNLLLAAVCAFGLTACNSTGEFDPGTALGLAGLDPTSNLGKAIYTVGEKGVNLSQTAADYMATGLRKYCENTPELVRNGLRAGVNAAADRQSSPWHAGNFCEHVAPTAVPVEKPSS